METIKHNENPALMLVQVRKTVAGNAIVSAVTEISGTKYSRWVGHELSEKRMYLETTKRRRDLLQQARPYFAGQTKKIIQDLSRPRLIWIPEKLFIANKKTA